MRFLANENIPREVVAALREAGHDAAWVHADAPGTSDEQVLDRARREVRVLLTFDKDFGALVFRRGATASRGVILFRIPLDQPDKLAAWVVGVLSTRADWEGHFAVVELNRVRMRRLPSR